MDGITTIEADAIYANITANAAGAGGMNRILARSGGFTGSLNSFGFGTTGDTNSGIFLQGGNLDANLTIGGNLRGDIDVSGSFPANRLIKIDAGIRTGAPITIDGVLAGQIILNAQNGTRFWESDVTANSVTLGPIDGSEFTYPQTSTQLGGGAVGMAPFRLHKEDCTPPHDETPDELSGPLQTAFGVPAATPVIIRHYGPIQLDSSITDPNNAVKIDIQNPDSPCQWIDMSSLFNVVLHPGGNLRAIGIQGAGTYLPKDAVYRARLVPNMLRSAQVTGNPAVVWPTNCSGTAGQAAAYVFRISPDCNGNGIHDLTDIANAPPEGEGDLDINSNGVIDECELGDPCRCDWNMSGMVSVQDIFDFLAAYFGGDADFNLSGTTSPQDIFDFLACWFGSMGKTCAW